MSGYHKRGIVPFPFHALKADSHHGIKKEKVFMVRKLTEYLLIL